jgi:hypothetical protein
MLRYVGEQTAVVWVETDAPCEVGVLSATAPTFHVEGHHYALLRIDGLEPGTPHEYEVMLDGERAWPPEDSEYPPSVIRTYPRDGELRVAFGSCRLTVPHEPPYSLPRDEDERARETDALYALAARMRSEPNDRWPQLLLMLGDQVYADQVSPETARYIERTRDTDQPPGERIANFEEYTRLYQEAWGEPTLRWLLSTVSTAMIFDDHDVHDDWNISEAWGEEMRALDWWDRHIESAFMSYWLYQHIGNLGPEDQSDDDLLAKVQASDDGGAALREFAGRADREADGTRWSYCRDLGNTRLIVIDSRAGRVLEEGHRSMLDEEEWRWVEQQAAGDFDHLLLATSVPLLLSPAMHELEAWNEAVCGGAWGSGAARLGEKLRQGLDLEHWAAFGESFKRLFELQRSVAAGERGRPPATIVALSGDVHHAYLHEVGFPRGSGVRSEVFQAVCSPFRNPLGRDERRVIRFAESTVGWRIARLLARAAGVEDPRVRWRLAGDGPWFDNQVATLEIEGRQLRMRIDKAFSGEDGAPGLESVLDRRLA